MSAKSTSVELIIKSKKLRYEQGLAFETYIKDLFGEKFKIVRWRKSELINADTFISDISYPDLELIFGGKQNYKFAVECKYRKSFYNGSIKWATSKQINCYQYFQNRFSIPVFIAIGIGGIPSDPEQLFVTPLCNIIREEKVNETNLIPYKRKIKNKFFYDTVQLRLWQSIDR